MLGANPDIRRVVERITKPVAKAFSRARISPNTITFIGFLISILAAYEFATGNSTLAGVFVLVTGFMDMLDGALARFNGNVTEFGGFFDSVLDRYSDAIMLLGIIYLCREFLLGGLALIGTMMVSYTRARAENFIARCDVGIAERAERLIIIAICAFLNQIPAMLIILLILTHITFFHRVVHTWGEMK
jgi:phosphatidylglycerophosphate synthase